MTAGTAVRLGVCAAAFSCTDPRPRPLSPEVDVQFVSTTATSPDTVAGSLYAFDADGLRDLVLTVRSSDSGFALDSTLFIAGTTELTRGLVLSLPAGRPVGSTIRFRARVTDEAGFAASDSFDLVIQ